MVADELHSADDLANGEETEKLGSDNAARGELGSTNIPGLLDKVLAGLDEGSSLDGLDDVLVVGLEGGYGAVASER